MFKPLEIPHFNTIHSKLLLARFVPLLKIKLWEEELDFSLSSLVRVGAVRAVASVGQTEPTADAVRGLKHGSKHFGRTEQCSPHRDGIVSCQNVRSDRTATHVRHEAVVEELVSVFLVKSRAFSRESCRRREWTTRKLWSRMRRLTCACAIGFATTSGLRTASVNCKQPAGG